MSDWFRRSAPLMSVIRPVRPGDATPLAELVKELGYPSPLDAVTNRLRAILDSEGRQILVAVSQDKTGIDGFVGLECRVTLHHDEHVEITELVVASATRRSGLGCALVVAGERWAARRDRHTVVVRSNVARVESHPFYEAMGYERTAGSHMYQKRV